MASIAGYPRPTTTQTATSLGSRVNPLFAGAPAETPFLPQILQPLPDPMVLQSQYEAVVHVAQA